MTVSLDDLKRVGYVSTAPNPGNGLSVGRQNSSFGQPITNSYYGINYMQTPLPVPMNKDHYGLVFFTRPQLNLQTPNLEKDPRFSDYLTTQPMSIFRAIRCYLDPRLQWFESEQDYNGNSMGLSCPLVDRENPFISLLSNHVVANSGWQDKISPIYRSPEGQYREVHSMVDGSTNIYGSWQMPVTFRNSRHDPITKLFDVWVDYPSLVFDGTMSKYMDYILAGLLDYQTRCYRLLLDPTKRFVTGIAATGVAFPTNVSKGQQYDFNADKPYNDAINQITIQFEATGAFYEDFRLIHDFNAVVGAFNSGMEDDYSIAREMTQVPHSLASFFNCRAYPRIHPDTKELQWWVRKSYFDSIVGEANEIVNYMVDQSTNILLEDGGVLFI